MGKIAKKIHKYYEYATTKGKLLWKQKKFSSDGVTLKYLCTDNKSDCLAVIFSSCTRQGIKARYNYVRTLKHVKCNQLFILDDFASDHRGGYYIGSNMQFNEEKATIALIDKMIAESKAQKVMFCGSSKGGWAALNFGLQYQHSYMICGGPQYYLGSYLGSSETNPTLVHIIGAYSKEKVAVLDHYLENRIKEDSYADSQTVYIHYSDREHTYREHICFLMKALQEKGIRVECDVAAYENHSDISLYFPQFLVRSVQKVMDADVG